jgi:hypothetical protein
MCILVATERRVGYKSGIRISLHGKNLTKIVGLRSGKSAFRSPVAMSQKGWKRFFRTMPLSVPQLLQLRGVSLGPKVQLLFLRFSLEQQTLKQLQIKMLGL